jgi:hypothetical protein
MLEKRHISWIRQKAVTHRYLFSYLPSVSLFFVFIFARFPINSIFARGDVAPLWLNRNRWFLDLFTWDLANGGAPSILPAYAAPALLWQIGYALGFSPAMIQTIEEAGYHAAAAAALTYLAFQVFPDRPLLAPIASIFYTLHFDWVINSPSAVLWLRIFLPLIVALFLDFCKSIKTGSLKRAKWIAIFFSIAASVGSSYATINLPLLIVTTIVVFFIVTLSLFIYRSSRLFLATFFLILLSIALSAWWIPAFAIPYISLLIIPGAHVGAEIDPQKLSFVYSRSSFLNLFQQNPLWIWREEYFGFFHIYSKLHINVLLFLPMMFAIFALIVSRSYDRGIVWSLTFILVTSFYLSKGLHPPFASLNLKLYQLIPGMWLLREPYAKLGIFVTIIIALLSAYTIATFLLSLKSWPLRFVLMCVAIMPTIIASYPLFFKESLYGRTRVLPSAYVSIPWYWSDASGLNNDLFTSRVLILPSNQFYQIPYTWGYYGVDFLSSRLLSAGAIQLQPQSYLRLNHRLELFLEELYRSIEDGSDKISKTELLQQLGQLGIEYLLVRNDVGDRSVLPLGSAVPDPRLDAIRHRLEQLGVPLVWSIGSLDLYQIPKSFLLPRVYIYDFWHPTLAPTIHRDSKPSPNSLKNFDLSVSMESGEEDEQIVDFLPAKRVIFSRINPTLYYVSISGAQSPFLLILNEAYHPFWKVYLGCDISWEMNVITEKRYNGGSVTEKVVENKMAFFEQLLHLYRCKRSLSSNNHVMVNEFANGWLIDGSGDYTAVIEFTGQRFLYIGWLISFLALIFSIWYALKGHSEEKNVMSGIVCKSSQEGSGSSSHPSSGR